MRRIMRRKSCGPILGTLVFLGLCVFATSAQATVFAHYHVGWLDSDPATTIDVAAGWPADPAEEGYFPWPLDHPTAGDCTFGMNNPAGNDNDYCDFWNPSLVCGPPSHLWILDDGAYIETTCTVPVDEARPWLFVQFYWSNSNDGAAEIAVREAGWAEWMTVSSHDTFRCYTHWISIEGLAPGDYCVRVTSRWLGRMSEPPQEASGPADDLHLARIGSTAAPPIPPTGIQDVHVDRGRDTDAPDWASYHQRFNVRAAHADGAGEIVSVATTDPDGEVHILTPTEGGWWSQLDDYTIECQWEEWARLNPPLAGYYTITVTDAGANEYSLTTAWVAHVSEVHPQLLAPAMDSVIYETVPIFEWTTGIPGSDNNLHVEEEGTWGEIWFVGLGPATSAVYNFDGTAARPELLPGHSYFWMVDSWYPDDDRVTDSRVSIWTAQHTHGRFTVYEPWPALPELSGKFSYDVCFWGQAGVPPGPDTVIWGMHSIMGYNTDPNARVWLGPDWSGTADWSPDGSTLLYSKHPGIWIDLLDSSAPTQIPGIAGGDCRWAPDGNRIVYTQSGPPSPYTPFNDNVWIASTDGSDVYPLVDDIESQDRFPVWSPDGLWIAYRKIPHPASQGVRLVRYDGTEDHALTATGVVGYPEHEVGYMGEHAWSPDGLKLAVRYEAAPPGVTWGSEGYDFGIGTIAREGGLITPVFIAPLGAICCASPHLPQWSPDGTKIVFNSGHHLPPAELPVYGEFSTGPELWLMNADGSGEPVRLTYDYSYNAYTSWWAPNTEPGEEVSVVSGDTTVIFESVDVPGTTTAVTFDDPPGPEPEGFQFMGDYYDISTDAEISGTITIEIHYDGSGMTEEDEQWLSLLHWEGGETGCWVDITVRPIDTANDIIRGECTSLSAFGVASGYQFVGLLPPVNNDDSSVFKVRRTVPVKFQLTEPGGAYVSTADARLYLAKVSNNVIGTYEEAASTSQADSGNTFRYDAEADQYIFNLGTRGRSTGTWCLQVVVNGMVAKQVLISLR